MLELSHKSITALVFSFLAGAASAQPAKAPLSLKPNAPDRYVVVPGDTLWGIAERFTDAPWRWSELWEANKERIRDPNRIYPGDVIVLDRPEGRLSLSSTVKLSPKVRVEGSTAQEIPPIPASAIEPYLSRPLVVEADGLDNAPSIVDTADGRVILAAGDTAYVGGMSKSSEQNWYVYRRGNPLVDPDSNTTLGYEAVYLGTAQVTRGGDPATIRLTSAVQEIVKGDKLIPAGKPELVKYAPHAPKASVKGRVMSVYGASTRVGEAGRHSVVALNRGKGDGLEAGHVLALHAQATQYKSAGSGPVALPGDRYGLTYVFKVFDRVAYALVMDVSRPVRPGDVLETP